MGGVGCSYSTGLDVAGMVGGFFRLHVSTSDGVGGPVTPAADGRRVEKGRAVPLEEGARPSAGRVASTASRFADGATEATASSMMPST